MEQVAVVEVNENTDVWSMIELITGFSVADYVGWIVGSIVAIVTWLLVVHAAWKGYKNNLPGCKEILFCFLTAMLVLIVDGVLVDLLLPDEPSMFLEVITITLDLLYIAALFYAAIGFRKLVSGRLNP
ncbi:hypothetical protein ACJJIU_15160 [Microbulbifer sp. CnH-101-E]|uniref:hypothetical protein n=1 Tax=unclassified Microbulbifer TaxID=2619833 RepID=UPI00403A5EA4